MFDGFDMSGEPGLCFVHVVNVGSGDAKSVKFDARFVYITQRSTAKGVQDGRVTPYNALIEPVAHHGFTELPIGNLGIYAPTRPTKFENVGGLSFVTGDMAADLVGRIIYEDATGTRRETGFTWRYNHDALEFVRPETNDQFNYED